MQKKLILKVVHEDMTSHDGFQWPESGPVKPVKWDPMPECGNGLHGWLNGEGNFRHSFMEGKWIVFEATEVVSLDGGEKVKASDGEVVFCGARIDAVRLLIERGALTKHSDPGWCCFGTTQMRELAFRAANRAKRYVAKILRATKSARLIKHAEKIEATRDAVDASTAEDARRALSNAASAASCAAYNAAYNATSAAYNAASCAAFAASCAAEREEQRLDKLELLGFKVRE
jgi:hypothetical protein